MWLDLENPIAMGFFLTMILYVIGYFFRNTHERIQGLYSIAGVYAGLGLGPMVLMISLFTAAVKGYSLADLVNDYTVLRPLRISPVFGASLLSWSLLAFIGLKLQSKEDRKSKD
ncbi:MAG: hypothetical protein ACI4NJ_01180 [Cellvibrio sp.]